MEVQVRAEVPLGRRGQRVAEVEQRDEPSPRRQQLALVQVRVVDRGCPVVVHERLQLGPDRAQRRADRRVRPHRGVLEERVARRGPWELEAARQARGRVRARTAQGLARVRDQAVAPDRQPVQRRQHGAEPARHGRRHPRPDRAGAGPVRVDGPGPIDARDRSIPVRRHGLGHERGGLAEQSADQEIGLVAHRLAGVRRRDPHDDVPVPVPVAAVPVTFGPTAADADDDARRAARQESAARPVAPARTGDARGEIERRRLAHLTRARRASAGPPRCACT